MKKLPRIGVLGGMGPAATILLQQRILDAVPVTNDADHIPLLIDMNSQVPSRIDFLIHGRGENPGPVLAQMASRLEANQVDAIVMPCCTAHHFASNITAAVSIPFLNAVILTARAAARHVGKGGKIGILASPATDKIGLFKAALADVDLEPLYPQDAGLVLEAIETIKASGPRDDVIARVQSILEELVSEGAGAMIIGCTEFSLIARQLTATIPMIDAIDELTSEIVALATPGSSTGEIVRDTHLSD